jgi:S1-C subfamily serine protease
MLIPLYGFVEGDTIGVLVLADSDMLLAQVGDKLRESAAVRVDTDEGGQWQLYARGEPLDLSRSVSAAGLSALDRIDLRRRR